MRERNHFVGAWLNDAEYRRLKKQCDASGLSASAVFRKSILGEEIRPRPPDEYAALLRELSAIGNNVNQLAYWANVRGCVSEQEITEAAALARRAWDLVKNGL